MFETGKVYSCQYMNAQNDPSPLILVFNADMKYVEAMNVNYLNRNERKFVADLIMAYNEMFKNVGVNGMMLYKLMKRDIYPIIQKCYRKYHFKYIRGHLVSHGLKEDTTSPIPPERVVYKNNNFVKYLNRILTTDTKRLRKAEFRAVGENIEKSLKNKVKARSRKQYKHKT